MLGKGMRPIATTGRLQLLELLEISWNLELLLEILDISWNLVDARDKKNYN